MKDNRNLRKLSKFFIKYTACIIGGLCAIFAVFFCLCCVLEKHEAFLEKSLPIQLIAFIRSILVLLFHTPSVFESFEILFMTIIFLGVMVAIASFYSVIFIVVFFPPHNTLKTKTINADSANNTFDNKFFSQIKIFVLHQQYRL